jgi:acetoin utilization deacetylase AcuC-like enzyme
MPLTIFRNNPNGHEGTPDRDNPDIFHDSINKFDGCLEAAYDLDRQRGSVPNRSANPIELPPINFSEALSPYTEAAILSVHSRAYFDNLRSCSLGVKERREADGQKAFDFDFGYEAAVSPGTFDAAFSACAACLSAVDKGLANLRDTAFALVWPPGHHAEGMGEDGGSDKALGFSYFSNAAIAAKYARDSAKRLHLSRPNRVAVIDIDHHAGNGTRQVLANQEDTLVIDLRYRSPWDDNAKRYTDFGWDKTRNELTVAREFPYDHVDPSLGNRAHISVDAPNIVSLDFWGRATNSEAQSNPETRAPGGAATPDQVLRRFINEALPKLRSFSPDVVILSVGLDSAENDPLGGLGLNPGAFYTLTRGLRLAFPTSAHIGILEGGYDPDNWYRCLQPVLIALHEDPSESSRSNGMFKRFRRSFEFT